VSEAEDFLAAVLPRQVDAGTVIHNGEPWSVGNLWSHTNPVTLFRARVSKAGPINVAALSNRLGGLVPRLSSHEIGLAVAGASGELAYEKTTASVKGDPAELYALRVTHVHRREEVQWRIVHRHGVLVPARAARCGTVEVGAVTHEPVPGVPACAARLGRETAPDGGRPATGCWSGQNDMPAGSRPTSPSDASSAWKMMSAPSSDSLRWEVCHSPKN